MKLEDLNPNIIKPLKITNDYKLLDSKSNVLFDDLSGFNFKYEEGKIVFEKNKKFFIVNPKTEKISSYKFTKIQFEFTINDINYLIVYDENNNTNILDDYLNVVLKFDLHLSYTDIALYTDFIIIKHVDYKDVLKYDGSKYFKTDIKFDSITFFYQDDSLYFIIEDNNCNNYYLYNQELNFKTNLYDYMQKIYYNNNCIFLLVELNNHYGVIDVYENILVDIIYNLENPRIITRDIKKIKFLDNNNNSIIFDLDDIYEESKKIQNIKLIYK